jgi:copper(I)-binding protein
LIEEASVTPTHRRAGGPARVTAALLAGAAVALGLVGCSAGQITQTADQVAAVPGANVTVGLIALRDLQIAYNAPAGYPAGGNAPMIVRIFNEGAKPVKLTGASAKDFARSVVLSGGAAATPSSAPTPTPSPSASASVSASASPSGSAGTASATASASATPAQAAPAGQESFSIEIPAQGYVLLVPGQGPYLQLVGLTRTLTPGMNADVTFTFDNGATAVASLPFAPAPNPVRGGPVVPGENKEHE